MNRSIFLQFDRADDFKQVLARVIIDYKVGYINQAGYIDKMGKFVWRFTY